MGKKIQEAFPNNGRKLFESEKAIVAKFNEKYKDRMKQEKGIQLGGGIFIQYRRSCGYCKHHRVSANLQSGDDTINFCSKAYKLENDNGDTVTSAYREAEDKVSFNQKYSVAANTGCEEHFIPVSNRYELS